MRPSFHPRLVNGPFEDPGLFIPFLFEKRAVMFDLGDNHRLSTRDLLKISHVFVTHAHMDHFVGFDRLLRLMLGREKGLHLYGPAGFIDHVRGKLGGYTWNLVDLFSHNLRLQVTEVHPDFRMTQRFDSRDRFEPQCSPKRTSIEPRLLEEPALSVSAIVLDHHIPCLGLSLQERFHVNIRKDALLSLGLEIGPWIHRFKQALYNKTPRDADFVLSPDVGFKGKRFPLGALADRIARISPGQKVVYFADVGFSSTNLEKMIPFAKGADHLFIEAAFLERDIAAARDKCHLTAWQAGSVAAKAGVREYTVFHFSPRYWDQGHLLVEEAHRAFDTTCKHMNRSGVMRRQGL
jgi:ribonuclease Z